MGTAAATLAIANQKGGVGKSSLCANVGYTLASRGRKTLLIDLDPQASLSAMWGIEDPALSLADVLGTGAPGKVALEAILREVRPGLWIAPADISLAATELALVSRLGREAVLRRALAPIAGEFERVLIDCPPSLGLLTVAGLAAADRVLIPTEATGVALRALRIFLDTVASIRAEINPGLRIAGVVPMFYDGRLSHHQAALEALAGIGAPILRPIPRTVRVAEAATAARALAEFDQAHRVIADFETLTDQLEL